MTWHRRQGKAKYTDEDFAVPGDRSHLCWNPVMAGAPSTAVRYERASNVERADHGARLDRVALVGLTLLSIGLPLIVAGAGGALGIPRNDDFSYQGILFHWSRTGSLRFDNWPAMTLVGQLVIARPVVELVGARVTALQILTTVIGTAGACASYLLLRRATVRGVAVAAVLTTLLGPLWAPLAASFMTDVWAYTAIVLCLFVGSVGLTSQGGPRLALLASSAAIGLIAVSIRESGFIAPVAVLGVAGWSFIPRSRRRSARPTATSWRKEDGFALMLIAAVLVAAVGLVLGWRSSIPFGGQSSLKTVRATLEDLSRLDIWGTVVEPSFKSLFTLGLLTLPATALVSLRRLTRRLGHPPAVALGASLTAAVVAILAWRSGPVGNYVMRQLGPSLSLGTPDDRLSNVAWSAIAVVSAYSCFVLVLCVVSALARLSGGHPRMGEERDSGNRVMARRVVTTFSVLSIGLMIVSGPFGQPIYDRHLLPLVPFVAAFVMMEGGIRPFARKRFVLVASSVLGAFAVLSLVFSTSSAVYDGTRWRAASDLVASGIEPMRIDGGLDWVGFHSGEPQRSDNVRSPEATWWASSYDDFRPCVLIVSGKEELGGQYGPKPVRKWVTGLPFGGDMTLRAFERLDCTEAEMTRDR
jgi:hypothetical protein